LGRKFEKNIAGFPSIINKEREKSKKSAKQKTCARRFLAPHRSGSLPSVIGLREGKGPQGDVKDENRAAAVVDTAGKWTYNKERIGAWSKSSF